MKQKRGDTLIEVALAIGIFSLVAIVIVSVVSASTSGAQSSLELTLTREELDAQAEALRFIHDSYVSGSQSKDTKENVYSDLWNNITGLAIDEPPDKTTDYAKAILNYNPETCSSIYNGSGSVNNLANSGGRNPTPFIINARNINGIKDYGSGSGGMETFIKENVVIANGTQAVFRAPETYPRILYGTATAGTTTGGDQSLQDQTEDNNTKIQLVEGLYIIGVKGESNIVDGGNPTANATLKPAYYDFYIRSCWMPVGSDRASTISTVVRLYDPAVIIY